MPSTGIEPATLQPLTWCSNQLSPAAQIYLYLWYKQTFYDKSKHNRKQSFVTHLHKIVTLFKKLTQNFNIFYFKIVKSHLVARVSSSRPPVFLYYSHTRLLKKYPPLIYVFLNEFIKLCDQLCFS